MGSNESRLPDGNSALTVIINPDMLSDQLEGSIESFFRNTKAVAPTKETMTIYQRDICFTLDPGMLNVSTSNSGYDQYLRRPIGNPIRSVVPVTSSLNGIEKLVHIPKEILELAAKDQRLMNYWIKSAIKVMGVSYVEMHYAKDGITSSRSFGVRFAGIATKRTTRPIYEGEHLQYDIPNLKEFDNRNHETEDGIPRSKISLILCPVREADSVEFFTGCYALASKMSTFENPLCGAGSMQLNIAAQGRCMEKFALVCVLVGIYWTMKHKYLGVEEPCDPATKQGLVSQAAGDTDPINFANAKRALKDKYVTSRQSGYECTYGGNKVKYPSGYTEENDKTRGSSIFTTIRDKNHGNSFERWVTSSKFQNEVAPVAGDQTMSNLLKSKDLRTHHSPEQVVGILSHCFGITDFRDDSSVNTPDAFVVDEALRAMTKEQIDYANGCKNKILNTIFSIEKDFGVGDYDPAKLEVGYHESPQNRLASLLVPGNAHRGFKYVSRGNGYSALTEAFQNAFPMMACALGSTTRIQRSMHAGKAVRGGYGGVMDADWMLM